MGQEKPNNGNGNGDEILQNAGKAAVTSINAASGALAGATLGGPAGAIVGGILGAIAGSVVGTVLTQQGQNKE